MLSAFVPIRFADPRKLEEGEQVVLRTGALLNALGVRAGMDAAAVTARVDALYAGTKLTDKAERGAWLSRDASAFEARPRS